MTPEKGLRELLDDWVDGFSKEYLDKNLVMLTPEQQAIYLKMYPNGPSKEQIYAAADQIKQGLEQNNVVPWPQCTW